MVKTKLRFAGVSDPGKVRRNNEDAWYADPEHGIYLVVDGIGGQAAGEKAAEIAVDRVRARLERQTGTPEERIREAITMANNEIFRAAQNKPEWSGMACVLTLALVEGETAAVGHVGDSRLYKIRRGEITKVTHDHSPVGEREDNRELTEAEAMRHPRRNEVYRDVGSEEHRPDDPDFIEVLRVPFEPDAALVLCSDGLSDQVPSAEILRVVETNAGAPQLSAIALAQAANRAGGKDNVTVIVVEGESFTPAVPGHVSPPSRPFSGRFAMFVYGILLAGAMLIAGRRFWIPAPVVLAPRVLEVGKDRPYSAIMQAMGEARPGDTVVLYAGEYREQVQLRNGVTLRSSVPREAILRASPFNSGPAVVAENVNGARVAGLWIDATGAMPLSAGIVLTNADVEIEDVEISGVGVGIEIRGESRASLIGNSIHDCAAEGVLAAGNSTAWLSHNSIARNKGAGIAAREGARPALVGNVLDQNGLDIPNLEIDSVRARNYFLDLRSAGASPGTRQRNGSKKK